MTLAALAMTIQALLPSGFMIAKAPAPGSIEITLCSGEGPILVLLAPDGQITKKNNGTDDDAPKSDHDKPVCAFAAHSGAAFSQPVPQIAPIVFAFPQQQNLAGLTQSQIGLGLAAPPPPKTGPPIQA